MNGTTDLHLQLPNWEKPVFTTNDELCYQAQKKPASRQKPPLGRSNSSPAVPTFEPSAVIQLESDVAHGFVTIIPARYGESQYENWPSTTAMLTSTIKKQSDHIVMIPSEKDKYMKMFQRYFANKVSLKRPIAAELKKRIKGVESVGLGFSTERRKIYWPVIRVIVDEKTCEEMKRDNAERGKTVLTHEVAAALKEVLTQLHPSTSWNEEELKNTIEIVINYPLKAYERQLCSAGDMVETTYNNRGNQDCKQRGTMGYSVCHKVIIGDKTYTSHYGITAYHPLIPSHSVHFQKTLHPLPTTDTWLDTTVKYKYIKQGDSGDVAPATSPCHDSLLVPTVLQATIFPLQTKSGFELLKQRFNYTCKIHENKAELVVGKSGLVKYLMTNDEDEEQSYEYNIVENAAKKMHEDHPCNIDVAVLRCTNDDLPHSIEESFAHVRASDESKKLVWSEPLVAHAALSIEEQQGEVVYIANEKVYSLSDTLIKFNDPPAEADEYPGYVWDLPNNVQVPHGHSGAPVFLVKNGTTYRLLGNLITAKSASPVRFSLDVVRDDIAIDHIEQILAAQVPYDSSAPQLEPQMIKRLRQYKQHLTWHREHQSLTPLMEERYIRCELSICIQSKKFVVT